MGACVAVPTTQPLDKFEADLPPPVVQGNEFQKFELSLPFACMYARTFQKKVQEAAESDKIANKGDGSTVTLESLRKVLTTPAWIELKQENSRIAKTLNSSVFHDMNGNISVNHLILYGFLNCPDDADSKSEMLYNLFTNGGARTTLNPSLSAMDKEIKPVISKLVSLCTTELSQLMQEVDGSEDYLQDKEDSIKNCVEDLLELNYLEPIYGLNARLDYSDWSKQSQTLKSISQVWYDSQALRMLTFTRARVIFSEQTTFQFFCNENKINLTQEPTNETGSTAGESP